MKMTTHILHMEDGEEERIIVFTSRRRLEKAFDKYGRSSDYFTTEEVSLIAWIILWWHGW